MAPAQLIVDLALSTATGILSVLLALLFVVRGLHRLYPVFFSYWIFDALQSLLPFLPFKMETFARFHVACQILQWFFYFLLVLELMDRILSDHPGLARLGRRVIQVVMIAAAAGAVYTLKFDPAAQLTIGPNLRLLFQAERAEAACLLIFMLLVNFFLWTFPVRLSRNTRAYCWGFTLFFLVTAIAPFFVNPMAPSFLEDANKIHLTGYFLCQAIWLVAVTKAGVERTPAFPRSWSPDEQRKALATLDAFEQQISRTRGR